MYCNRSCRWVCVCVCVCGSVTTITRNCVRRFSPNLICILGEGSDRLQLIKFWPSRAPRRGLRRGRKFLVPPYYKPARSVCVSVSAFFIKFCFASTTFLTVKKASHCARCHPSLRCRLTDAIAATCCSTPRIQQGMDISVKIFTAGIMVLF